MTIPFSEGLLDVGAGHNLYYAQYGRPDAPASVVVHGGPGSGCNTSMLEWFDLSRQRVVLFDQRGAGRSTPAGGLLHNTTQDVVDDIERLRQFLHVPRWLVVGGSWGALLGVMYASTYPASVRGLILRGIFLPGAGQLKWFFQDLQALVPIAWAELTAGLSASEKPRLMQALASRLLNGTLDERRDAAVRWARYEEAVMAAMAGRTGTDQLAFEARLLHKYRLQAHYLSHGCFVTERGVFRAASKVSAPTIFVHGTHDWVCPPQNVFRLMRFMPSAEARWAERGTHTTSDSTIQDMLRTAIFDMEAKVAEP